MNPRLVALDGALEGEIFVLAADDSDIGRSRGSAIHVPDASISRVHCSVFRKPDGTVEIADHGSRNGTFVNGVPIERRLLVDGDEIRIGACRFLYLTRQEKTPTPVAVLSSSPDDETRTVIQLRREDALYLHPDEALDAAADPARVSHSLRALLNASRAVRVTRGVSELARDLFGVATDAIPANEGALLLLEAGRSEPVWSYAWRRDSGPAKELPVPDTLVRRCFGEDIAILSNTPAPGSPSESETDELRPSSALLAPLSGSEGVNGVIYLASNDPLVCFDEEQLQVLTAISAVSGLALENALQFERLHEENRRLRKEVGLDHDMVGETPTMEAVYRFVSKVAPTESTVLITGESGTGKELVARAIHRNSKRAEGPYVAVNCAALTETLLESELFGHEKGSFTGAINQKKGKFEIADGGTVFLDEIAEMPASLQAKLLRVLQEREFERVGGNRSIKVNVRVMAATNRNLEEELVGRRLREDLYYRLNVVSIRMPALRERRADIPLLAGYFATRFSERLGRAVTGISAEARARMAAHDWPGNVRELENVIERAVVLGSGEQILAEDLPEELLERSAPGGDPAEGYHGAVREAKRKIIRAALERAGGSQKDAATLLGVNPTYLSRLIRNLELR